MDNITIELLKVYIYSSALICLLWGHYDLFYSKNKEELQKELCDLSLQFKTSFTSLIALTYLLLIWFGWILLPMKIFKKIKNLLGKV